MPNTYSVYLNEANGDDLAIVSRLPGVVALYSAASQFGDDGFTQLRRLKTLRVLSIAKATITDRSLKNIAALPKLESLHLSDTLITEDGLQRLSAKLPSCSIEYKTSTQRNSGRNGTKAALFDTPFPALHNM